MSTLVKPGNNELERLHTPTPVISGVPPRRAEVVIDEARLFFLLKCELRLSYRLTAYGLACRASSMSKTLLCCPEGPSAGSHTGMMMMF